MDNVEATGRYRKRVRDAIVAYTKRKRETWERFGKPLPLSPECAEAMIEAWVECRIAWHEAARDLAADRRTIQRRAMFSVGSICVGSANAPLTLED
jgi:hypothetical protein